MREKDKDTRTRRIDLLFNYQSCSAHQALGIAFDLWYICGLLLLYACTYLTKEYACTYLTKECEVKFGIIGETV